MSFDYMMIQTAGVSLPECFTLLGVSTNSFVGYDGCIGQFGSGTKYAINLLLRNDIDFCICCGRLKLKYFTKPEIVDDTLVEHTFNKVFVRVTGKEASGIQKNYTKDLGWTLELGMLDWD